MALPGHSPPPPFQGPRSPPRHVNGYHDHQPQFPMYGPQRPMPPPSPQHFPRFSQPPYPPSLPSLNYHNDTRAPLPHKRPGSSMSISSMLGSEPERPHPDPFHPSRTSSRYPTTTAPPMSLSSVMSPPQQPPKPSLPEYPYKPRSQTPDNSISGPRPYRSSSGSLMQRPSFQDQPPLTDRLPPTKPPEQPPLPAFGAAMAPRDEAAERARRTSLSGILQRPESAPQRTPLDGHQFQSPASFLRPEHGASAASNGSSFASVPKTNAPERPIPTGSYDTRPPPFSNFARQSAPTQQPSYRDQARMPETRDSQSLSPELKRAQVNGEPRGLAGLLNDPTPSTQNMIRQDSVQSQSDRSVFGERFGRGRAFSPFAPSIASQTMSVTSVPTEERARKGSDELSAHRSILGLHAESKRGRYSPVPQAVQGAQAQTPVPDAGVKTEHGRVFAGLGGASMPGPTSTPQPTGLRESPFRQNETAASRLSEENLMKMSRSASGIHKRARKYDDDVRAESEAGADGRKKTKRSKYAHSYKIGLEDARRDAPLSGTNGNAKRTPMANITSNPHPSQSSYQPQIVRRAEKEAPLNPVQMQVFKPKKTIQIGSIIEAASRQPRRHLGNFKYNPAVDYPDFPTSRPNAAPDNGTPSKFEVAVRPNLLPCFDGEKQVNCTYCVRVPKLWLGMRERKLIARERAMWGSGVYSDDSDVVAAAMHAGWIKSGNLENEAETILAKIVSEQNARVEGGFKAPEQPLRIEPGKDMLVTLVVLPSLEKYPGSSRYGITSRSWPEGTDKLRTPHDGVSFSILDVEFVGGGFESRRTGRTGAEKRARLQKELRDRIRAEQCKKELTEKAKMRREEAKRLKRANASTVNAVAKKPVVVQSGPSAAQKTAPAMSLDVGQAPGDWLKNAEM